MTADFAVFCCSFQSVTGLPIKDQLGEAVQALFFQLIQRISPPLVMQGRMTSPKAYAVSALMDGSGMVFLGEQVGGQRIQRGQTVWLQFVGLEALVVEALVAYPYNRR